jgi:EmrB/QacA subfamily drug resistance transporter
MSTSLHASSSSAPLPTGPAADSPNRTATIALACLGVFVSYLPVVGVSSALPVIQEATDASTVGLQWITDAFILPTAALLLTFGVVGDLYGRKKIYLSGLSLTVIGSLIALIAHSVVQICIGQALIGIGTAALLPSTLGLISHVCPDHHVRARAIAAWTASLGLGLTLGPLINGQILNHVGWRWIFLPTLVLGAIIAAVGAFTLTDSRSDRRRHLDVPGQILAIVGIAGVVYGVIEGGGTAGWSSPQVIVAFILAGAALVAFVAVELRSSCPMLDMRLFRSGAFSGAAIVMGLTLFAQVGLVFALSEYFGLVHHASTWDIGVRLIALNGFTVILGPLVGRMMTRVAPGLLLFVGLIIAGAGALLVNVFKADTGTGEAAAVIAVLGIGIALAMAPITTIAVNSLPRRLAGTAGSANSALRQIGSALGPAVFGVILTSRTLATLPGHLAASGLSRADQGQVDGMVSGVGIQAGAFLHESTQQATGQALTAYAESFTDALHTCALVGGIGILVAAVVALVLIGVRARGPQPDDVREEEAIPAATPAVGQAG